MFLKSGFPAVLLTHLRQWSTGKNTIQTFIRGPAANCLMCTIWSYNFSWILLTEKHYSKVKSKGEKFFLNSFTMSVSDALSVAQAFQSTLELMFRSFSWAITSLPN